MVGTAARILVVMMAIVAAVQGFKLVDIPDITCDRGIDLLNCTNRFETLDYILLMMLAVLVGLLAV